jgi:hypothetical protein
MDNYVPVFLYTEACGESELPEICNYNFAVVFEKDVFTFQVSVYDTTRVEIAHCLKEENIHTKLSGSPRALVLQIL